MLLKGTRKKTDLGVLNQNDDIQISLKINHKAQNIKLLGIIIDSN